MRNEHRDLLAGNIDRALDEAIQDFIRKTRIKKSVVGTADVRVTFDLTIPFDLEMNENRYRIHQKGITDSRVITSDELNMTEPRTDCLECLDEDIDSQDDEDDKKDWTRDEIHETWICEPVRSLLDASQYNDCLIDEVEVVDVYFENDD